MAEILIRLDGEPRGKGRPRFGRGRTYTDPLTAAYERALRWEAKSAMKGRAILTGPLKVRVYAEYGIPESWPKWKRTVAMAGALYHTGAKDLDNTAKLMDALNGVVWKDDGQVACITAWKKYGPDPHVSFIVSELPDASAREAA